MTSAPLVHTGAGRGPRAGRAAALVLVACVTSGCNTVDFTEMQAFSDPVMTLADGPACTHLRQKVLYSSEGAAGGVGTTAGGGCGCY